ncbi:MAG: hypothetical protein PF505_01225 [Vallitaleaceae bacterium]|jgi:hypothetical protein|nr:hypothetical protein [Vallitaleaceae bacterium]
MKVDNELISNMHYIRKKGNLAIHEEIANKDEAIISINTLYDFYETAKSTFSLSEI